MIFKIKHLIMLFILLGISIFSILYNVATQTTDSLGLVAFLLLSGCMSLIASLILYINCNPKGVIWNTTKG